MLTQSIRQRSSHPHVECVYLVAVIIIFNSLNFCQDKDLSYSKDGAAGVLSVSSPPGTGEWRLFPYRELGKVYAMFMFVHLGRSLSLASRKKTFSLFLHRFFFFIVQHFQKHTFQYMHLMCINTCRNLLWHCYTNIQIHIFICSNQRSHIIWLCDLVFLFFFTFILNKKEVLANTFNCTTPATFLTKWTSE